MAVTHLQNAGNLPQITTSNHTHTLYSGTGQAMGYVDTGPSTAGAFGLWKNEDPIERRINAAQPIIANQQQQKEEKVADPKRRLVKVVIIDPDEKVPLNKCILYSGEEKLTDLTDQELFFEIEVGAVLIDHNKVRASIVDKSVKERTEHLEPIKVRDLRMVVVTVASF